jgi:hypothetical protein
VPEIFFAKNKKEKANPKQSKNTQMSRQVLNDNGAGSIYVSRLVEKAYDMISDCRVKNNGVLRHSLIEISKKSIVIITTVDYPTILVTETFDDYDNGDSEQRYFTFTLEEKPNIRPKISVDGTLHIHIKKPQK